MSTVAARLAAVRERIAEACQKAGRNPQEVKILAVTKTHPAAVVEEAIAAGVDAIGENRVQEAAEKRPAVRHPAFWHLVGPLQRNKAKKAIELFDLIATVDRVPLAETLERLLANRAKVMPVMVEVNVGREPQKSGVLEEELPPLVSFLLSHCPHLQLLGLLTVPPYHPDPERSRPHFRRLREVARQLEAAFQLPPLQLSMGMSEDFWVAVEEGATWVRLGRALFGERR
ncbi:MAG: YggS family pyridoxal phosphate enzyme [Thermoanaerobaculum sp.]|nr:MAG: YggS family pyridoxal phosphate enzyme [Thermoanaerobaculum sp.]